jgi:hypothetical protein
MSAKTVSFAILAFAALTAPAAAAEAARCNVTLAVTDQDPKGLNVRSAPDAKASIVAVLKGGDYIEVHVTGQSGQWYAIDRATRIDTQKNDEVIFKGKGFVHGSKIGGSLDGGSAVLDKPDDKSGKPIKWDQEHDDDFKLLGCSGQFVKIQGKKAVGWSDAVCTNQLTTCV